MERATTTNRATTGALALMFGMTCFSAAAQGENSLDAAIKGGVVSGNIRLRHESVSDDAVPRDARAMTVRTRLGYETAPFHGFSVAAEFEDVSTVLGVNDYAPEKPGFPVVADPTGTELNRAFIRYQGIDKLDVAWGRQRINHGNQRFVGAVGWRQNDQTFDGVTVSYGGIDNLTLAYAYVTRVNGITGAFDSKRISDHFVHVSYSGFTLGKLSVYGQFLDHSDETNPAVNPGLRFHRQDTYGVRFDGTWTVPQSAGLKLLYAAEYARQEFENSARTASHDANYRFLEAGLAMPVADAPVTAKVGWEVLGSDGGAYGFQTPFGTRHAFNGWADKFLVTPGAGLRDRYLSLGVGVPPLGVNLLGVYHRYDADRGPGKFGSEWNLQAVKTFSPTYTLGIKYANYQGKDLPYRDTDKLWVWGEINF